MARHARRSFEPISPSLSFFAEIQQLPAASRYSTTTTQPPIGRYPILGMNLKRCIHAAYTCPAILYRTYRAACLRRKFPNTTSVVTAHGSCLTTPTASTARTTPSAQTSTTQRLLLPSQSVV